MSTRNNTQIFISIYSSVANLQIFFQVDFLNLSNQICTEFEKLPFPNNNLVVKKERFSTKPLLEKNGQQTNDQVTPRLYCMDNKS